jgi:DNA primase
MTVHDLEFRAKIDAARDRHLLSAIIGRHTMLKKRGARELVGLCPFHKERSPSFEVNDAKGTFHCHGCGAGGDVYTVLTKLEGMSFRQAYETLSGDTFPTISEEDRARRKVVDEAETAKRIDIARSIWASAVPIAGTPGEVYARARGITAPLPESIRFALTPRWRNDETGEVGRDVPAVVCAVQDVAGAISGVQCIFLAGDGRRKYDRRRPDGSKGKAKLSFGIIAGGAIRLGPPRPDIVLCEGPEDGWTLMQELPERTVWVACGTSMLPRVRWPEAVMTVCLAGDNNGPGQRAAALAAALVRESGRTASQVFPPMAFKDWNDQLRGIRI